MGKNDISLPARAIAVSYFKYSEVFAKFMGTTKYLQSPLLSHLQKQSFQELQNKPQGKYSSASSVWFCCLDVQKL